MNSGLSLLLHAHRPSFALLLASTFLMTGVAVAQDASWDIDVRGRWEAWQAPSGSPAREDSFDFGHARVRVGADWKWQTVSVHGTVQAAATSGLPEDGSFGIGPAYVSANQGDTDPAQAGLAELSISFHPEHFRLTLGRQKWADGGETGVGIPYLDGVKKRRMAERLVGNWDWVNVGRRYDGLTFSAELSETDHLAGFYLRPLAGGTNYDDAFEELDDLTTYGLTYTNRYGGWLQSAEVRLWAIGYDDQRSGAVAAAGGPIDLLTYGASVLAGGERADVIVWTALQTGDWGAAGHEAFAYFLEGGYRFGEDPAGWSLRAGVAQASGDPSPTGDHETFFNLLPTNHKFYGAMDFNAFSNLLDAYVEASVGGKPWSLSAEYHWFELSKIADAWYGGSGAFAESPLGYAGRRVAGGFRGATIGQEIDVKFSKAFGENVGLLVGASAFFGGEVSDQVLPIDNDGWWAFTQLSWKH